MNRYYIRHVTVAALGFLMGALFAIIITPGDAMVLIVAGIVFSLYARALFDQDFGGEWFWPFGRSAGRNNLGAKPSTGHRQSSMVCK